MQIYAAIGGKDMSEFIKKENKINHQENLRRKTKISLNLVNQMEEDLKQHIDDTYKEAARTKKYNPEVINNLFEQAQYIEEAKKNLGIFDENINSIQRKTFLTNEEKDKIYHYYSTGDYKQEELADIFGTNQSTISRIISSKNGKK